MLVFLFVLVALALLLFIPISVRICYNESGFVACFCGLKVFPIPRARLQKSKFKPKKRNKFSPAFFKKILAALIFFAKNIKTKRFVMRIKLGRTEACETAVSCGILLAALIYLGSVLSCHSKSKSMEIALIPNFFDVGVSFRFDFLCTFNFFLIFRVLLKFAGVVQRQSVSFPS